MLRFKRTKRNMKRLGVDDPGALAQHEQDEQDEATWTAPGWLESLATTVRVHAVQCVHGSVNSAASTCAVRESSPLAWSSRSTTREWPRIAA